MSLEEVFINDSKRLAKRIALLQSMTECEETNTLSLEFEDSVNSINIVGISYDNTKFYAIVNRGMIISQHDDLTSALDEVIRLVDDYRNELIDSILICDQILRA